MTKTSVGQVDLTDGALYEHGFPHDVFAALRQAGPVHRHPEVHFVGTNYDGPLSFWSVVAHREIEVANRDWETFSAIDGPGLGGNTRSRGHSIVAMDPPDHTRIRRLISAGFTPRMIAKLDDLIVRRTEQVLDAVADKGHCEFVSEVAYQLPMHVIADIVGIPDDDRAWVFERSDVMIRAMDPSLGMSMAG